MSTSTQKVGGSVSNCIQGRVLMAARAVQITLCYVAYNVSTGAMVTGDGSNHTLYWSKDGTASAAANGPHGTEVSSAHMPGIYSCVMTSTETDCEDGVLGGSSTTANVILIPTQVAFVYVPNAVAGASGGLLIAGSNAATSVNITGNITGNLSGSVGSVTGAVGSVTGNVGGNVTGSVGSVSGNIGGNLLGTLTATERNAIADANLNRDMTLVTITNTYSPGNALRTLRNKIALSGVNLTVFQEDGSTTAYTATVSTLPGAAPIVGVVPT